MNSNLRSIILYFTLIGGFIYHTLNIEWNKLAAIDYLQVCLINLIAFVLFGKLCSYLKNEENIQNKKLTLAFIRVLLPFLLGFFSLVYVFSSGLFNTQKANLEFDKNELTLEKRKLSEDSLRLTKTNIKLNLNNRILSTEKDSLLEIIEVYKDSIELIPEKDRLFIELRAINEKILSENKKILKEHELLKLEKKILRNPVFADINNSKIDGKWMKFDISFRGMKLTPKDFKNENIFIRIDFTSGGKFSHSKDFNLRFYFDAEIFAFEIPKSVLDGKLHSSSWELLFSLKNLDQKKILNYPGGGKLLSADYTIRLY